MSDGTGVVAVVVDDDAVSTRRACVERAHVSYGPISQIRFIDNGRGLTTSVNAVPGDGELLPRAGDHEVEAFVVVVAVRVVVAADLLAALVVVAGLVDGCVDLGGGVGLLEDV